MQSILINVVIAAITLSGSVSLAGESTTGISSESHQSSDAIAIETFTPPSRIKVRPPKYPREQQYRGQEGWVSVNYMVDPDGKPYDITITDSTDRAFEKAAIRAIRAWRYEPALLDGTPIDAGEAMRITFALSGATGAMSTFVGRYKKVMRAIESGDQEKADAGLEKIKKSSRNLYEEAYYHLALYQYSLKWIDDPLQQLRHLNRATSLDQGMGFLPDKTLTSLMASKLQQQLALNRLAEAWSTSKSLADREISDSTRAMISSLQAEILAIKESDKIFHVRNNLDNSNRSSHQLLKNEFAFTKVDGDIAELRLHCDKGFVGFTYKPDFTYTINPTWDNCRLIMIGTPGTTYTLQEGA